VELCIARLIGALHCLAKRSFALLSEEEIISANKVKLCIAEHSGDLHCRAVWSILFPKAKEFFIAERKGTLQCVA
jgi:hypothetical protein